MSSSLSGSPLRGPLGPLGPLGLKPIPGGVIGSNRAPGGTAPLCLSFSFPSYFPHVNSVFFFTLASFLFHHYQMDHGILHFQISDDLVQHAYLLHLVLQIYAHQVI